MVNILVPIDFSQLSKSALKYAIRIANRLGGNITVLHIVTRRRAFRASMMETLLMSENNLIENYERELERLIRTMSEQYTNKMPIKFQVVRGAYFPSTLLQEARRRRSGLIVMGTRGASGLTKAVLGSNTTSVIEVSHVPVLAVPEKADFRGFRNVVYASDLENLEGELDILIPYIEKFGSMIHLLHIVPPGTHIEGIEAEIEEVLKKYDYRNIITLVLVAHDIDSALGQYVQNARADVLAMFTHEPSFFEKVFDRSTTRRMAFHSNVPLLAFRQVPEDRGL